MVTWSFNHWRSYSLRKGCLLYFLTGIKVEGFFREGSPSRTKANQSCLPDTGTEAAVYPDNQLFKAACTFHQF